MKLQTRLQPENVVHGEGEESAWKCSICATQFPVLTLARLCEKKHHRKNWYHTWNRRLPAE